ncbi:hypothetical protein H2200_012244 [Cladophialophora chaetospira]|uniref:N-acetyltransferase domain-containing protein n=1 Tax=Cladophialophora chaetospira TaxID=386627 RepID=A0AA38WYJ9_9EURO|nr:hypothetical protein H2200_012244 [Cladophialophora chaetospira]
MTVVLKWDGECTFSFADGVNALPEKTCGSFETRLVHLLLFSTLYMFTDILLLFHHSPPEHPSLDPRQISFELMLMAQQDDAVLGPLVGLKRLRQLPSSTNPSILQRLKTLERKSFAADEVFDFDDRVAKQRNLEILVAFHGHPTSSSIAAYAVYVTSNRRLLLHKICVSPSFRRKRIGTALMERLIGDAKHRSCRAIDLWVDEANDAARSLYSRHGFLLRDSVQDYYSPGRNE